MSHADDLRVVVELACLTEDRTEAEQLALLRVALKADNEANALTVTNRRDGPASRLLADVWESGGGTVDWDAYARWVRRADLWDCFHGEALSDASRAAGA